MRNRSFASVSWKVVLAALPGLFIVGTRSGFFRQAFGLDNWLALNRWLHLSQGDLMPVYYLALGIVVAGLVVERRLAVWSFPALGLLLSGMPEWIFAPFAGSRSRFWQIAPPWLDSAVLAAMAALAIYWVYRQGGIRLPRSGYVFIGLMILTGAAAVTIGAMADRSSDKWASIWALLPLVLWWMGLILSSVAIGLPLAWRNGLLAGLVVVAFEFVLVDRILDPTYHVGFWAFWEPDAKLGQANILLSYLPALVFLVITPVWVLLSRSTSGRIWALIVPPFVALAGTEVLAGAVLQGTSGEYSLLMWLTRGVGAAQLLIPLVLVVIIYHRVERRGLAANTPGDVLALSDGPLAAN